MPKALTDFVSRWCQENGWTDLFVDHCEFWAFPPGAVMPLPIPADVMAGYISTRQLPRQEKLLYGVAIGVAAIAATLSFSIKSPMPLVLAFGLCALLIARLDDD
ncbi:hypothetical protein GS597_11790 [Synechococcales cyanobacterium C]|uniref:Uncharacterized protein n=1 Tax=Petrachloros mirabilis ULC683 TaxID=2781853 RepID=A0A8K2A7Q7_9CYAN|nr:hypothetical protein [Petrachloros mirabilis]NCJ07174.1 hypothetical protein [Petrachloros mirabilis ULC683]